MSSITLDEILPLMSREVTARRGALLLVFMVVSLTALLVALLWENKYTSLVQLYVDDSRIVAPIVGAETSLTSDQANVAREELFSADIMNRILEDIGYVEPGMSAQERERTKNDIIEETEIHNINNQLIEIEYHHSDPQIAYETAALYATLFLEKSKRSSTQETTEAFEFIIDQVGTYRTKLEDAEARLQRFQAQYPGVSNSTDGNVEQRIIELRRDLEQTQLLYAAATQRSRSLQRELNSESSTIATEYQNNQLRQRIGQLQNEVDTLRLSYTDDYPDIVRLNQQIADLAEMASQPSANPAGELATFNLGNTAYRGAANLSPVYQQLRSDLALTTAEAEALGSRLEQLRVLLDKEVQRSTQASRVERELAVLSRDYQINKELYEDLLRRQESARLSMSLGAEQEGVLYRIAEPASFPVLPSGLRFVHIAAAGLMAGAFAPLALLLVFLKLDPRIRTASAVTEGLELPLLTTVPHMVRPNDKRSWFSSPAAITLAVIAVFGLYVAASVSKLLLGAVGGGA